MYRAVIVEDDPMVSFLNQSYLESDGRFQVIRSFRDGAAARDWLLRNPADLLILDVYMPRLTGLELLRVLRSHSVEADAILVTAAQDARTVDALLKLGAVDYLVKPFTRRRFQQALDAFCLHREAVSGGVVTQEALDHLFPAPAPRADPCAPPPKGMQESTLERMRSCLSSAPPEGLSSEAIARQTGLSVVTVRHYMRYLLEQGAAVSSVKYDTGGRPSRLYHAPGSAPDRRGSVREGKI